MEVCVHREYFNCAVNFNEREGERGWEREGRDGGVAGVDRVGERVRKGRSNVEDGKE